jgi:hypothetical protein
MISIFSTVILMFSNLIPMIFNIKLDVTFFVVLSSWTATYKWDRLENVIPFPESATDGRWSTTHAHKTLTISGDVALNKKMK